MRFIIFVLIIIGILAYLYYYQPSLGIKDWIDGAKPATTTGTEVNAPPARGMPFQDMAMTPEGTSPLQQDTTAVKQAPQPMKQPVTARNKFYQCAKDSDVTITFYSEPQLGNVTVTVKSNDRNKISDFMDALEKAIQMRDIKNSGYSMAMDPNGRSITISTLKIIYTPESQ